MTAAGIASPAGTKPAGADPRPTAGRRSKGPGKPATPKVARDIPSQDRRGEERITVPLSALHLSEQNVRKAARYRGIAELADDVATHGVLQNLIVRPSTGRPDMYEVTGGGRRFCALDLLLERETIGEAYAVPVLVDTSEDGREASLSENLHTEPLNPADEAEAWADLVAARASLADDPVAYLARRFGVTTSHMQQRLRLAALPPEIREALRDEQLPLDAALAYASVPDADLQATVFAAEQARVIGRSHDPRTIREAMRMKTLPATARQYLYVGHDAYAAAGGRLGRDLFMGADEGDLVLDTALVDRLAREKAIAALPARAAADGFASGLLTLGFNSVPAWPKAPDDMVRLAPGSYLGLARDELAPMVAVYNIAADGIDLELEGVFKPVPPRHAAPAAPRPAPIAAIPTETVPAPSPAKSAGTFLAPAPTPSRTRSLYQGVVADLVVGTALAGRVSYPILADVPAIEFDGDRGVLVAIQVRLSPEEIEQTVAGPGPAMEAAA